MKICIKLFVYWTVLFPKQMVYCGQDPLSLTFNSQSWDRQISLERVHLNTETDFCAGKQSALLASSRLWLQMSPRNLEQPLALIILRSPFTQNSLGSLASANLHFVRVYINWSTSFLYYFEKPYGLRALLDSVSYAFLGSWIFEGCFTSLRKWDVLTAV